MRLGRVSIRMITVDSAPPLCAFEEDPCGNEQVADVMATENAVVLRYALAQTSKTITESSNPCPTLYAFKSSS